LKLSPAIFPLGDAAITIDLGNHIDEQLNRQALALQQGLAALHLPGIKDIIVAYSSVSVFYDPVAVLAGRGPACREGAYAGPDGSPYHQKSAFACLKRRLEAIWQEVASLEDLRTAPVGNLAVAPADPSPIILIPVCYESEYAPDLELLVRKKELTREEIIRIHTAEAYRVYMIGFLPGFPYLGKIDQALEIPRKERPVPVIAGGVGIAGNQTGIYPLTSPGGWQIIGRTPLKLFDSRAPVPVTLQVGDRVQFFPISGEEFRERERGVRRVM